MSSYNGANTHNVESILASIRSTIGDEHDVRAHRPTRAASAPQQQPREVVAEEASEFELPAIFKPGHASPDARPNLLGRLSDALKPTAPPAPEPDRSRTVIRFEPASARMSEPPPPVMPAPSFVPPPRANPPSYDPASKALHENDAAPRVMTSFFDTRMKSMSSTQNSEPRPAPAQAPFQAPFASPPAFASPPPFASAPPLPPRLPERSDPQAFGGGMEDAAAQMLRPILRQWLTENMPKIVEKALRSEAGDEFPRSIEPPSRKTLR